MAVRRRAAAGWPFDISIDEQLTARLVAGLAAGALRACRRCRVQRVPPAVRSGADAVDLTRLDVARHGGGSSAMPLPRAGTAGMVQYLNPSEPASRARLERSALFARKAAPAVGARFETQGWTWRDAEAAAEEDARQEEGEDARQ